MTWDLNYCGVGVRAVVEQEISPLLPMIRDCAARLRVARTGLPIRDINLTLDRDRLDIQIVMDVKDREVFRPTIVVIHEAIPISSLEHLGDLLPLLSFAIFDTIRRGVLHELDECWQVDGTLARDPHRLDRLLYGDAS